MFDIDVTPEGQKDLEWFRKFDQVRIGDAVEAQLRHQPDVATKNRKPLRAGHLSQWELRIGELRVFYEVEREDSLVKIVRIGCKKRARLFFRGQEYLP